MASCLLLRWLFVLCVLSTCGSLVHSSASISASTTSHRSDQWAGSATVTDGSDLKINPSSSELTNIGINSSPDISKHLKPSSIVDSSVTNTPQYLHSTISLQSSFQPSSVVEPSQQSYTSQFKYTSVKETTLMDYNELSTLVPVVKQTSTVPTKDLINPTKLSNSHGLSSSMFKEKESDSELLANPTPSTGMKLTKVSSYSTSTEEMASSTLHILPAENTESTKKQSTTEHSFGSSSSQMEPSIINVGYVSLTVTIKPSSTFSSSLASTNFNTLTQNQEVSTITHSNTVSLIIGSSETFTTDKAEESSTILMTKITKSNVLSTDVSTIPSEMVSHLPEDVTTVQTEHPLPTIIILPTEEPDYSSSNVVNTITTEVHTSSLGNTTEENFTNSTSAVTVTTEPALNTSSAYEDYWVVTVIYIPEDDKTDSVQLYNDMERRLAALYDAAYKLNSSSKATGNRNKRAATVGDVKLQVVEIKRDEDKPTDYNIVYYMLTNGNLTSAATVIKLIEQFRPYEVSQRLKFEVLVKAYKYLPPPEEPDHKLWIIGAVFGGIVVLIGFCWCILFLYFKCTRAPTKHNPRASRSSRPESYMSNSSFSAKGFKPHEVKGFDVVRTEVGLENEIQLKEIKPRNEPYRKHDGSTELEGMYSTDDATPQKKSLATVSPPPKTKPKKKKVPTATLR